VGLVSGPDWRGRFIVGTCPAKSAYCRDLLDEVGYLSVCVRRGVLVCLDLFGEVGLVSGRVLRGRLSVGTCPKMSAYCRDVFGDVWLFSGRVR